MCCLPDLLFVPEEHLMGRIPEEIVVRSRGTIGAID